jgi:uncharacterized membrane protein YeaQ/YmgE (transglycosylase-associated protein family)
MLSLAARATPLHPPHAGNHESEVEMFGVIGWIVFGLIVGIIAKLLTPGRDPGGFVITALIGIAGALFAGWLGRALGWYQPEQGAGLIASIVGAVILLAIYHLLIGRRTTV